MKDKNPKIGLVATLGATAPVVSEIIAALKTRGVEITHVYIVHTSAPQVFEKRVGQHQVGLKAFLSDYCPIAGIEASCFPILDGTGEALSDIHTEEDNKALMETLFLAFETAKAHSDRVYLSIAGGRKTMSAIGLMMGTLIGCQGIFHVQVKPEAYPGASNPEAAAMNQHGFFVPSEILLLIQIPTPNLDGLITNILGRQARPTTLLSEWRSQGKSVHESLNLVNRYIFQTLRRNEVRQKYDRLIGRYDHLQESIRLILTSSLKGKLPKAPSISARTKTFESLWAKTLKSLPENSISPSSNDPFETFIDIAGVRIVTPFASDIEQIRTIIEEEFEVLKEDKKDSPNGYWGLHFPVKLKPVRCDMPEYRELKGLTCEIQVRTTFADTWASSEHSLRYKSEDFGHTHPQQQELMNEVFSKVAMGLKELEQDFEQIKDALMEKK